MEYIGLAHDKKTNNLSEDTIWVFGRKSFNNLNLLRKFGYGISRGTSQNRSQDGC
jgi:hypothetical protein